MHALQTTNGVLLAVFHEKAADTEDGKDVKD